MVMVALLNVALPPFSALPAGRLSEPDTFKLVTVAPVDDAVNAPLPTERVSAFVVDAFSEVTFVVCKYAVPVATNEPPTFVEARYEVEVAVRLPAVMLPMLAMDAKRFWK